MTTHTLHNFGTYNTIARRRRVRDARRRVAATRARMAKLHTPALSTSDTPRGTDTAD
jgi:hypothetical protein